MSIILTSKFKRYSDWKGIVTASIVFLFFGWELWQESKFVWMCAINCIVGDIASVQHNLEQFHWFMYNNAWNFQTLLLKSPKLAKNGWKSILKYVYCPFFLGYLRTFVWIWKRKDFIHTQEDFRLFNTIIILVGCHYQTCCFVDNL